MAAVAGSRGGGAASRFAALPPTTPWAHSNYSYKETFTQGRGERRLRIDGGRQEVLCAAVPRRHLVIIVLVFYDRARRGVATALYQKPPVIRGGDGVSDRFNLSRVNAPHHMSHFFRQKEARDSRRAPVHCTTHHIILRALSTEKNGTNPARNMLFIYTKRGVFRITPQAPPPYHPTII